ncbi:MULTISPECIES: DUF962 domain-containing protein [unclassified Psychrobacter]|uniref:DUF962 domain-containing protein n=1 Tax=unclassified Psychrobacter TaxID=196806 RepID=UPI00071E7397|nr:MULTISPECIES: DUF962 domain-containing protein [unclassified Psychrobacter]OLF37555.1 hypothetical protein BTV98_08055 [Psychrobacter sp. Cmf 22.2]
MNQSTRTQSRATANIETKDAIVGTDITKVDPVSEQGFYDFYLNEHQNIICRRLHFAGSSFGLLGLAKSVKTRSPKPLLKGIAAGYACAWAGHFFFEKNKPATFKYPLQSFVSDFRMYGDVLRGNLSLSDRKYDKTERK